MIFEAQYIPLVGVESDVTSEISNSEVTLNVACELSQPMGKTEFFSTAEKKNTLCFIGKEMKSTLLHFLHQF